MAKKSLKEQLAEARAVVEALRKLARPVARKPDFSHIGGVIQSERELLGRSLRSVAEEAGINPGLLNRCEVLGKIELRTLIKIAKALGSPASGLLEQWETRNKIKYELK